ncbi:hypothetical protein AVEN_182592-1, partial [Araneus ventricosus]
SLSLNEVAIGYEKLWISFRDIAERFWQECIHCAGSREGTAQEDCLRCYVVLLEREDRRVRRMAVRIALRLRQKLSCNKHHSDITNCYKSVTFQATT